MLAVQEKLIQQDDNRFVRNSGIPRWACLLRTMMSKAEIDPDWLSKHSGAFLTPMEIQYLIARWWNLQITPTAVPWGWEEKGVIPGEYELCDNLPLVLVKKVDGSGRPELWCTNIARVCTETYRFVGLEKTCHYQGALQDDVGSSSTFTALHGTTSASRYRGSGGHWIRGDAKGQPSWDPCRSIKGFELDGTGLRFWVRSK